LNNIRYEASRNTKRNCLKDKINEIAMNSKNDKIRGLQGGINEFKRATNLEVTE
jgi:hypothetical protein